MGYRDWIIAGAAGALVTFAGGQVGHAYEHPFDPPKHLHIYAEGYEPVRTTDNIVIVQTTGSPPLTITVEDGIKVADVVELRSA